jgi:hypothetical protein
MADKTETEKTEPVKETHKTRVFLFPRDGVTVEAKDRKDAVKQFEKTLKETKES